MIGLKNEDKVEDFLNYLSFEKKYSDYTVLNYELDLEKLGKFLGVNKYSLNGLDYKNVNEFIKRSEVK